MRTYTSGPNDGDGSFHKVLAFLKKHGIEPQIKNDDRNFFQFKRPVFANRSVAQWFYWALNELTGHVCLRCGRDAFQSVACESCGSLVVLCERCSERSPREYCSNCPQGESVVTSADGDCCDQQSGMGKGTPMADVEVVAFFDEDTGIMMRTDGMDNYHLPELEVHGVAGFLAASAASLLQQLCILMLDPKVDVKVGQTLRAPDGNVFRIEEAKPIASLEYLYKPGVLRLQLVEVEMQCIGCGKTCGGHQCAS